jgi:hypothetical protein
VRSYSWNSLIYFGLLNDSGTLQVANNFPFCENKSITSIVHLANTEFQK